MKLRDYQEGFVRDLRAAFQTNRRVLGVSPVGSGKTQCFSYIAKGTQQNAKRIVIVAHRRELLKQISTALDSWLVNHAVLTADSRGTPRSPVVVASAFTLVNRLQYFPDPDLLIIDEAHHAALGTTWSRIVNRFDKARILGMTASPIRLDGRGLGDSFDAMVVGPSVAELTAMNWLAPAHIYAPKETIDLRGIRITGGDYAKAALAASMDKPSITGNAVEHYTRLAAGKRAVVFCCSIQHAQDVAAEFRKAGYTSEHIDGKMEDYERDSAIQRFRRGSTQIMTSCDILGEGFDLPDIEVAILLRPTKSLGLCIQQIGRALRPMPGKDRAIILDHAGCILEHGFPDEVRTWSLDGREAQNRERRKAITVCPSCRALHAPMPRCPRCGYEYGTESRMVRERDDELVELTSPDDLAAATENMVAEDDVRRRYNVLLGVARYKQMENKERWARDMLFGEIARMKAKSGERPGGFMINGLTIEERDDIMKMIRGTKNQIELVV